jgi:hypothetical protein
MHCCDHAHVCENEWSLNDCGLYVNDHAVQLHPHQDECECALLGDEDGGHDDRDGALHNCVRAPRSCAHCLSRQSTPPLRDHAAKPPQSYRSKKIRQAQREALDEALHTASLCHCLTSRSADQMLLKLRTTVHGCYLAMDEN